MRRFPAAFVTVALVMAILPGSVSADRITKFEDHHVGAFCEMPIDGGYVAANIDSSTEFGDFAGAQLWLDPALPFEDPPSISGATDTVNVIEGPSEVLLSASFTVMDADGNPLGDAQLEITLAPSGEPEPIVGEDFGNHHSKTEGTFQPLAGTGVLTLPDGELVLDACFGDVTTVSVFESNPRSFVIKDAGIVLDCFWETPDGAAYLFMAQNTFGFFADAGLFSLDRELFQSGGATGSLTSSSASATIPLVDPATGDPHSATAEATLTPIGSPVKSILTSQNGRVRITEQALEPSGSLEFSTGDSFDINSANCRAVSSTSHSIFTQPAGPKPGGAVPVNDSPDGAIQLSTGSRVNVQTRGAAEDAEVPITTCPEGPGDDLGRTLWYSIAGTGGPVTIDTAGSNFDTVLAVYVRDGADFIEVACNDDVLGDPVGATYQAAVTLETEVGTTYLIQVGGYRPSFFFIGEPQYGRLRLAVS
ncbi:MAG: hypothetical protein H0T59_10700 [Chloroflexi bacterium]|nr:hypothetical protein [Chloroflexota bacterium]